MKKHSKREPRALSSRAAFTLMELLVTISIIGLLAAILLPAINSAIKRAEITKAQMEVTNVEAALKAYFQMYNRWPTFFTNSQMEMEGKVVKLLRGEDIESSNPQKNQFMEFPEESLSSSQAFLDPWGEPYRFMVDLDYDNKIPLNVQSQGGGALYKQIAVWSTGPDPTEQSDDVGNWQ